LLAGKKKGHPKIESVLFELQEEYIKDRANAKKFAKKRALKVKEKDKITVFLISEAGKTVDAIDKKSLIKYGAEIIKSGDKVLQVDIPVNRIKKIADNVKGISFITLPDKPTPEGFQSEGVNLSGASVYHSAGYTGSGVKVAIIDSGFRPYRRARGKERSGCNGFL